MRRAASLLKGVALAAAIGVLLVSAAPGAWLTTPAYASGPDDPDEPDFDEPDQPDEPDTPDFDEPDEIDVADNSDDSDNSGSGGGDDFDDHGDDSDNSGSGSDDDHSGSDGDDDHSGSGSGDDDDDNSGSGGSGSGDDDDDDNSGSGNSGSGDDDNSGSGNSGSGSGNDNSGSGSNNSGHGNSNGNSGSGSSSSGSNSESEQGSSASEETLYAVEQDARGNEQVVGEVVLIGAAADLDKALAQGFASISVQELATGGVIARLSVPEGVEVQQAAVQLAAAAPDAIVTPNNVYRSAQVTRMPATRGPARRQPRLRGALGIIDTGVDAASLPAEGALLSHNSFAGARPVANEHGSAVASIVVSRGVRVHVADVFGHSTDGALAASAERIAAAIDWMISQRVPVVNISVEGPNNAALQEMVRRASERGHIIVAAAGNGGPAARPAFPGAFDGVLAVTAIDADGRPYVRANRGSYIDFAAPGVRVVVDMGDEATELSGTSFAAPVVAAEAAARMREPSPAASSHVVSQLRSRAEDLGTPGRDNIFGWGALRD